MTREEIKNTPELVDFMLDASVIVSSREKLRKRLDEICNLAIKALEQTSWIPVSERFPEDGTYLICTDDGYIATIMYDRSMGWLLNSNIIAWMPLPEPYNGESEDVE